MQNVLECFLLVFSLCVLHSFCVAHANKECKKNREIIKDNILFQRIGFFVYFFFRYGIFSSFPLTRRFLPAFLSLNPKEIFINKPFLKAKVLFAEKFGFKFLYFFCCLLYYIEILLLLFKLIGLLHHYSGIDFMDVFLKNVLYYQIILWFFEAMYLIYGK